MGVCTAIFVLLTMGTSVWITTALCLLFVWCFRGRGGGDLARLKPFTLASRSSCTGDSDLTLLARNMVQPTPLQHSKLAFQ